MTEEKNNSTRKWTLLYCLVVAELVLVIAALFALKNLFG